MRDYDVDGDRMLDRLAELARVTSTPGRGVTRLAYSPEDRVGRDLVAGWMQEAGLLVHEDAATNVIGVRPGRTDRLLMTGSHLDSVKEAGHLDGAYGVLAAIEAAELLRSNGVTLEHTLVVIGFSNEEGARGTPGMTGSHSLVGLLPPEWLDASDEEGVSLATRIASTGGDPELVTSASLNVSDLAGFIELHIEQGPILQGSGAPIGVVQAITGRDGIDLELIGTANHAGTTPMTSRHDALVAAAHVVLAVQGLAEEGWVRVATVGVMEVGPGSSNVIPSRVRMNIEMRDADDARVVVALEELLHRVRAATELTGTTFSFQRVPSVGAVTIDPLLSDCVTRAAHALGLRCEPIDSGAGHDAQVIAAVAPVAMIFVPSSEGVSHSAREHSSAEHLTMGAEVLAQTLREADATLAQHSSDAPVGSGSV
jgi:hydantoinase/carbamoylase family amidase